MNINSFIFRDVKINKKNKQIKNELKQHYY